MRSVAEKGVILRVCFGEWYIKSITVRPGEAMMRLPYFN